MRARLLLLLLYMTYALTPINAGDKGGLDYVDPYIGSDGHGHVFVGASVPFGTVQAGPQNIFKGWDWCSGYHYSDSVMTGFSHTHLSGTGCTDLGDIQIMPFTGNVRTKRGWQHDITGSCSSYYSHDKETVSPYYYAVSLENGVDVELTATARVAFHRYRFPVSDVPHVLVNLMDGNGFPAVSSYIMLADEHTVVGYRIVKGWAPEHRVYFALKSSWPISRLHVYEGDEPAGDSELEGIGVKGVLDFVRGTGDLSLKVSVSSVNTDNALENIRQEIPHWDFTAVKNAARKA